VEREGHVCAKRGPEGAKFGHILGKKKIQGWCRLEGKGAAVGRDRRFVPWFRVERGDFKTATEWWNGMLPRVVGRGGGGERNKRSGDRQETRPGQSIVEGKECAA